MKKKQEKTKKRKGATCSTLPPRPLRVTQMPPSLTDPLGSYTGRPFIPNEIPVQDADDL